MNQKLHLDKESKTTLAMLFMEMVDSLLAGECKKCHASWMKFFVSNDRHICGCPWCWTKVRVGQTPIRNLFKP